MDIPNMDFEQMSKEYMAHLFRPVSGVYIDLDILQDFRLGALLSMVANSVEYDYVMSQMPKYDERNTQVTTDYFPALGFSEYDINMKVTAPGNVQEYLAQSPTTTFLLAFNDYLSRLVERNLDAENAPSYLEVFINDRYGWLTDAAKLKLKQMINADHPTIEVKFLKIRQTKLDEEIIDRVDVFFIYDIAEFVTTLGETMGGKMLLMEKEVYALPMTDGSADPEEKIEDLLHNTGLMLNVFCEFNFFKTKIYR